MILKTKTDLKEGPSNIVFILGLCFCNLDWIRLKLDVQGQGGRRILDVMDKRGWGSWKLDNFHGRRMCIIPYVKLLNLIFITSWTLFFLTPIIHVINLLFYDVIYIYFRVLFTLAFIANQHISHLFLVFLVLLNLNE